MIAKINYQNETIRRDTNARWSIHLIHAGALRAELTLEHAVRAEHLNTIVAAVGHDDVALVIDRTALRSQELTVAAAFAAQEFGRLKIGIYDEQTMIIKIGDNYLILLIERHTARTIELLPQRSVETVFVQELTVRVEQLNAMVARVRDEYIRLGRDGYIPRIIEIRPGFATFLTEFKQKGSIGLENLNTMIILVRDDYSHELVVESNTGRSVELTCSSAVRAELAHKLATAIKHLNTVIRAIGDDYVARGVATHAPRSTKLSVLVALASAVDREQRLADRRKRPAALHLYRKRTALNVTIVDQHRHGVDAVQVRQVVDEIRAVLFVNNLDVVELLVGSLHENGHSVAAHASRLVEVIFGLHDERGELRLETLTQAVAVRDAIAGERRSGEKAHLSDGVVESRIGWREMQLVGLARLKQRQELMEIRCVICLQRLHLFH